MRQMAGWRSGLAVVFGTFVAGGFVRRKVALSKKENYQPSSIPTEGRQKWNDDWDCMSPKQVPNANEDENKVPKATRVLLLVRHGQYNLKGIGDSERYLTDLGREQADGVGKRLKELEPAAGYTAIHQSTMTRAMETCGFVRKHLPDIPVATDPLLCEGSPIRPEPPSPHYRPESHEFFKDGARIEAAFRKYFHRAQPDQEKDSCEILVCHANVVRYFVCRALQLPPEAWLRLSHGHCGITRIVIRPNGRVSLRAYADTGHFPREMITYS